MRIQGLYLLGMLVVTGGCYSYTPVRPEAVPAGEAVRIRLTPEEAARYDDLRLAEGRLLEGRIASVSDAALTVETTVGVNDPQRGMRALMQVVDVPFTGMVEMERRRLDNARTTFFIAGGVALITAVVVRQIEGNQGRDDGPGNGTSDARRLPIFRFRLSF